MAGNQHADLGEVDHIAGRSFLLDAEQIDTLAAGDFDGRTLYFSAASAMARSSVGVVRPPHMRGTTE